MKTLYTFESSEKITDELKKEMIEANMQFASDILIFGHAVIVATFEGSKILDSDDIMRLATDREERNKFFSIMRSENEKPV